MDFSLAGTLEAVLFIQAGSEVSKDSAEEICSQMVVLMLLALYWARQKKHLPLRAEFSLVDLLLQLPLILTETLPGMQKKARELAGSYQQAKRFLFLGRGTGYPLALEGALRLKKNCFIHAEGCPTGDVRYGPIALIDPTFPPFAVALNDEFLPINLANLMEVRVRRGNIIVLANSGVDLPGADLFLIPNLCWPLESFLVLSAIQLFVREMAVISDNSFKILRNSNHEVSPPFHLSNSVLGNDRDHPGALNSLIQKLIAKS